MKTITLLFGLIYICTFHSIAQEITGNIPPKFDAFVFAKGAETTPLEEMEAKRMAKRGNTGSSDRLNFEGTTSTVKIKKSDVLHFLYKWRLDAGKFKLVKLNQTKKKRQIFTKKSNLTPSKNILPTVIKCKSEPYGEKGLLISVENLAVGEYAFVAGDHDLRNHFFGRQPNLMKKFYGFSVVE